MWVCASAEVKVHEETFLLKWRTWTCRLLCLEPPRRAHRRDGGTVALVVYGNQLSVCSDVLTETLSKSPAPDLLKGVCTRHSVKCFPGSSSLRRNVWHDSSEIDALFQRLSLSPSPGPATLTHL